MLVEAVPLPGRAAAWFTGRDRTATNRSVGQAGNLSHRRPHRPGDLAAARAHVGRATETQVERWHLMQQVHGGDVATVDGSTPVGAELRGVDAVVTSEPDRPLAVQVADCVPVLLAGEASVGAAHAGRLGVVAEVVGAAVHAMTELGERPAALTAVIGPAIGGCCYEVPEELRDEVVTSLRATAGRHAVAEGAVASAPDAVAGEAADAVVSTTSWGTPSLDLPAAVAAQLARAAVGSVVRIDGCTRCDPERRWFSHRGDPDAGRQFGLIVRRATA